MSGGAWQGTVPPLRGSKAESNSSKQERAGVMRSGPMGLIAKLALQGSASCTARIDQDDLAESL